MSACRSWPLRGLHTSYMSDIYLMIQKGQLQKVSVVKVKPLISNKKWEPVTLPWAKDVWEDQINSKVERKYPN